MPRERSRDRVRVIIRYTALAKPVMTMKKELSCQFWISLVCDIFSKYVKGKSFIDIGPLYAISNEALTPAMQHGATRIAAADIQDIAWEPWKKLREHCASVGLHEYEEHSVNLDNRNIEKIIGQFYFVFCKGIIYHVPSPLYTIERLRSVTAKYLLRARQELTESF